MLQKTALAVAALAGALALTAFQTPAYAAIDDLTLVSGALGGPPLVPNQASDSPKLSGDGRYVAFSSRATNLVAGDGNGLRDVFRRDTSTGETLLVSRADGSGGAPGTSDSGDDDDGLAISADGRFVVFRSEADNLIVGDDDSVSNVYVRDVAGGRTYLASRNDADAAATGGDSGYNVDISGDGRYVVFGTEATNMPGTALDAQIVRRDILADATTLVSSTPAGVAGNGDSDQPRISDDGTRVAFPTGAVNLGADGSDPMEVDDRVVVRDLAANTLVIASRLDGVAGEPQVSFTARISADGRKAGWSTGHADRFYVRDLATGATVEASIAPDGGRIPGFCCYDFEISGDGRYVASYAGGDAADLTDFLVYHRDTAAGVTRVASRPQGSASAPAFSRFAYGVAISDSGRYVAFGSTSVALSDADYRGPTPGQSDSDVFLRDVLGPPPVVSPADTKAPAVSRVSVAPKRFRVAKAPTATVAAKRPRAKRRPAPRGTAIRFTLSEPATVRIAISRKLPGLRAKRGRRTACVAPTRRNRAAARDAIANRPAIAKLDGAARRKAIAKAERKLRCSRYKASGVLTRRNLAAGKRSVRFSGRIGAKALKPGAYRLQIGATDAAGNRSTRRAETAFRVVR
jgi:TolB protein